MSAPLYGYLDTPVAGASIAAVGAVLAGWVFNAAKGGQQPFSVRVRVTDGAALLDVELTGRLNAIERPDVQSAFAGVVGMSRYTGYGLTLGALPLGRRTITLEWSDAYGSQIEQVEVTVVA